MRGRGLEILLVSFCMYLYVKEYERERGRIHVYRGRNHVRSTISGRMRRDSITNELACDNELMLGVDGRVTMPLMNGVRKMFNLDGMSESEL